VKIELVEIACPLCQSTRYKTVAKFVDWTYQLGGPYQAVVCCDCRHRYLNPRPIDQQLLDCYPKDYGPHHANADETEHEATFESTDTSKQHALQSNEGQGSASADRHEQSDDRRSWMLARRLWRRWLDNRSTWLPPAWDARAGDRMQAIEIGCADGWYLQQLADRGWSVQGVEPVEAAARRARKRGFTIHVGSVRDVFVPSDSLDLVAAWMVLEHVPDPVDTVQQIGKWLKPKAVFAFSVPNAASLDRFIFRSHWSGYDGGRHLQFYTPRSLDKLLASAGLRIERVIHQNTIQPFLGSVGSLVNRSMPHSRLAKRMAEVYMTEVSFGARILCSPLANLVAWLNLSSRITIVARKV
jgi:2-polyprenyl-3-methyl-5-hydroxy-6-metoxy-1,4-benzoquinol methylase